MAFNSAAKRSAVGFSLYDDDEDEAPPVKKISASLYDNDEDNMHDSENEAKKDPQINSMLDAKAFNQKEDKVKDEIHSALKEETEDCTLVPIDVSALGIRKGERDEMQDAHIVLNSFNIDRKFLKRCAIYGIYDGHAGARAAKYCEHHLPDVLKKKLSSFEDLPSLEKSLKKTFTEVYKQIDDKFLLEARKEKPVWKDGTTASTVVILDNSIYVANIGDSRVVVCRQKSEENDFAAVQLTVDHNPLVYEERMRIQKCGGTVKDGRINGVIEVSRSIGDGHFKSSGIICTPDMKKLTITDQDRFLIAACDGLWKAFSNEEAIKYVNDQLQSVRVDEKSTTLHAKSSELAKWEQIASNLAAEAVKRKCGDNVSVILVQLTKLS